MSEAEHKLEAHLAVLIKQRQMTRAEGDHFVRHLKGVFSSMGELVEEKVKQLTR